MSRQFTTFLIVTPLIISGLIALWTKRERARNAELPTAQIQVPAAQRPTEAQVKQLENDMPYLRTEADLVIKLEMVHDNGGSEAEQCALIMALRMNAMQWVNPERYRQWSGVNSQEFLFERDVELAGIDLKNHSKKDEKRIEEIAARHNVFCPS